MMEHVTTTMGPNGGIDCVQLLGAMILLFE